MDAIPVTGRNGDTIGHGPSRRSAGDVALNGVKGERGRANRLDDEGAIQQRIGAGNRHNLAWEHGVSGRQRDRRHVGGQRDVADGEVAGAGGEAEARSPGPCR